MVKGIVKTLRNSKALLVFDIGDAEDQADDEEAVASAREFPQLLSSLFRETKYVKVLIVGHRPLVVPSLGGVGEHIMTLGTLSFRNTVKLFSTLCPHLHTGSERHRLTKRLCPKEDADLALNDPTIVRVLLVAVLSTVPYESLTPLTYVFSKEHILVLTVLRCVNDIDGTFL
jgi:hypothetical protein